uniref:Uncharacterized protein n=1 Tax=Nelumbo nucifera TaxID=4432 RepID=A0A822YD13_NELNU|nr:TPA_asm: hypothetical protein HUJ06_030879 [Nelumbo nucifera]
MDEESQNRTIEIRTGPENQDELIFYNSIVDWKPKHAESNKECPIPTVPRTLREVEGNGAAYDPQVVSIGPYHHGNSNFERMEDKKIGIAHMLVSESKQIKNKGKPSDQPATSGQTITHSDIEALYQKVKSLSIEAKKCYSHENFPDKLQNNDEFGRVMFLDGCFVVFFIHCLINNKLKRWELKSEDVFFIGTDLFLLENQLPLTLLDALMTEAFPEDAKDGIFDKFIERIVCFDSDDRRQLHRNIQTQSACHLLDLFRKKLVIKSIDRGDDILFKFRSGFCNTIGYFRNCFQSQYEESIPWHSIRSAAELKEAGINFKKSKSFNLDSVHFQKGLFFGYLTLPPIIIDRSTKTLFLNLLVHERSLPPGNSMVASYICFLDSLIDQADDVKVLRSDDVLINLLSTDEDAANMINHLAKELVDHNDFSRVTDQLKRYTQHKWTVWFGQVYHTHFSTPWTVIAFLGAIFIIILTIVQTYFTIFPR